MILAAYSTQGLKQLALTLATEDFLSLEAFLKIQPGYLSTLWKLFRSTFCIKQLLVSHNSDCKQINFLHSILL